VTLTRKQIADHESCVRNCAQLRWEVLASSKKSQRPQKKDRRLEGLIKAKEAAGRPRDLYVLPELRELAEFKKKIGLE
jgi:hypothetical protein